MIPIFSRRATLAGPVARALYDIAQGFDSPLDAEPRLRRALKLLRGIVPYYRCALLEAPAGASRLLVEPEDPEEQKTLSPLLTRFLTVLTDEREGAARWMLSNPAQLRPLTSVSHLAVPVIGLDRVLGVLYVRDGQSDAYTDHHLRLLSVVASQIAAYLTGCRVLSEHEATRAAAEMENRAKNEFVAMLGHELRTPLAPIRLALLAIRGRAAGDPALQRAGNVVERQVERLARLIDDMVNISRMTRGRIDLGKETVALQTIVAEALETARDSIEARGHAVSVSLPAEPLCFEADPVRIAQVVDELLNNAVKYTPRGGEIAVTGCCEGGEVVLRVRDTGIGVAPGMLPRVFDLFFQGDRSLFRSDGELGVGLALVRALVDLHGGSISAHSDGPGLGSEFVVRLPAGEAVGRRDEP